MAYDIGPALNDKQRGLSRGSISADRKVAESDISVTRGAGGGRQGERWRETGEMGEGEGRNRKGGKREKGVGSQNGREIRIMEEGRRKGGGRREKRLRERRERERTPYPLGSVEIWVFLS